MLKSSIFRNWKYFSRDPETAWSADFLGPGRPDNLVKGPIDPGPWIPVENQIQYFDRTKMIASNETILIENHLKCAKQIKQIILFFFDEIQKF